MPTLVETGSKETRKFKGGGWEINGFSQDGAWHAIETFPREVEAIRTELHLDLGFRGVESIERAIEAGVIPGTSLKWTYEHNRGVVKPDSIEFYNGVAYGGSYWMSGDNREEIEQKYRSEAEILRQVGKAVIAGGKINHHFFDLGGRGLQALSVEQLEELKAQGYNIQSFNIWLSQYRYTGYNEGVDMAGGIRYGGSRIEFNINRSDMSPKYKGDTPQVSNEDALRTKDWFMGLAATGGTLRKHSRDI